MKTRNSVWQLARGIAIVSVILIHCPNGIRFGAGSFNFNYWMIMRQFFNYPVALFLFMSGYFTDPGKVLNYRQYLVNRGRKLLLPYLFWSGVYLLINVTLSYLRGSRIPQKEVLRDLLLGGCAPQLYYCIVLLQLTIVTPLIIRSIKIRWLRLSLYMLTPAWLIYVYIANYVTGKEPVYYNVCLFAWIGFYVWGFCAKQSTGQRKLLGYNLLILGIIVTVLFEIAESYTLLSHGCSPLFACSQIRVSPFMLAFFVIAFLLKLAQQDEVLRNSSFLINRLIYIGDRSYGIFFVHYIYIIVTRVLVMKISIIRVSWILQAIICFTASLLLSLMTIDFVRWIAKRIEKTQILKVCGFD